MVLVTHKLCTSTLIYLHTHQLEAMQHFYQKKVHDHTVTPNFNSK